MLLKSLDCFGVKKSRSPFSRIREVIEISKFPLSECLRNLRLTPVSPAIKYVCLKRPVNKMSLMPINSNIMPKTNILFY